MTEPDDSLEPAPAYAGEDEMAEAKVFDPLPLEADLADVAEQKQAVDGFDEDYPGG